MDHFYPVFVLSDRSGLTAETLSHTLLSQFPETTFRQISMPFIDTEAKLDQAINKISEYGRESGCRPFIFSTLVKKHWGDKLNQLNAEVFNLFDPYILRMERVLGQKASHLAGQAHGISDSDKYTQRIDAVHFSLHCDDGLNADDYNTADLILLGVSRSGKTPTSLYMSLQYGLKVANYPLTEEDFDRKDLPETVTKYRERCYGLTINPTRLHQIRTERRPGSPYAALGRCIEDINLAEQLFSRYRIDYCDSSDASIEELGSTIKYKMNFESAI